MVDPRELPEVTRFVVKVPTPFALHARELQDCLKSSFPNRTFTLELCEDQGTKRIALVPVMEDAHGRAHLCRAPARSLLARIHDVANAFALNTCSTPA
jgi:hypothetical protein